MHKQHTRRGFTQIKRVGQALPDNAPAKGHLGAFTLIELLVVVLIIGILAAIAVPQYQVAVKKAELAKYIPLVKAIATAEEAYYLANGEYTTSLTTLDIELPVSDTCIYDQDSIAGYYSCATEPTIRYGVFENGSNAQAGDSTIRYTYYFTDDTTFNRGNKGDILCFSRGDIARKACKTLGPGEETKDEHGWDYTYKLK